MEKFNEQQIAAHQAIAEIAADLGAAFVLQAVADALGHSARSEIGARGDNLAQAEAILRQLALVLDESGDE